MTEAPRHIGRYEILERLGSGGMSEVFRGRARDPNGRERQVAIKQLSPLLDRDPSLVEMFLEEARLAAQLHHPAIVRLEEVGRDMQGRAFMVLEFIEGHDLRWCLAIAARAHFWLPIEFSLSVVRELARALAYAHQATDAEGRHLQLVHRDVSHSNIFLSTCGQVKLADFGIARARGRQSRTRAGMVKGKLGYVSPEQVRAEPLDPRTDIFSACVVLWELLTQRRMFAEATEFKTMVAVCTEARLPPSAHRPGLPEELDALVLRGVAIDRNQRYSTADELVVSIEVFAAQHELDLGAHKVAQVVGLLAQAEEKLGKLEPAVAEDSPTEILEPFSQLGGVPAPEPEPSSSFAGDDAENLEVTVEAELPEEPHSVLDLVPTSPGLRPLMRPGEMPLVPYALRVSLAATTFKRPSLVLRSRGAESPLGSFAALVRALHPSTKSADDEIGLMGHSWMPLDHFAHLAELDVGPALHSPAQAPVQVADLELAGLLSDLGANNFTGRLVTTDLDQQRACLLEHGGLVGLTSGEPGEQLAVCLVAKARGKEPAVLEHLLAAVITDDLPLEDVAPSILDLTKGEIEETRLALSVEILADILTFSPKQIGIEATNGWPGRGFLSRAPLELLLVASEVAWSEASLAAALTELLPRRMLINSGLPPLVRCLGVPDQDRRLLEALHPGRTLAQVIEALPSDEHAQRLGRRLLAIFIAAGAVELR